jgi:alcohol dehydrogenase
VTTASNSQPAQKVLAAIITPMLLKTVQSRKIDLRRLITHRFKLDTIMDAYDTFDAAARTNALSCHRSAGVAAWRRGKRQFCAGK